MECLVADGMALSPCGFAAGIASAASESDSSPHFQHVRSVITFIAGVACAVIMFAPYGLIRLTCVQNAGATLRQLGPRAATEAGSDPHAFGGAAPTGSSRSRRWAIMAWAGGTVTHYRRNT